MMSSLNDSQSKLDEANRTLNDFDATKKKLAVENADLLRQLEDAETQNSMLGKMKLSLTNQLDDTKKLADEEGEAKADTQRQLSKSSAECQIWKQKYEHEGI